ncbi:MAG: c-type cytochrome [Chitinophagales bacterium]|nr:c-type cytochrome [Chitinophagales bacterium]
MKYAIGAILGVAVFAWLFSLCSPAGKNKTGHEYMPDMYHPVSYEANQYSAYHWNHWDGSDDGQAYSKAQLSQPRGKVNGTIPRGYTAVYYTDASALDMVRGKNASNAIAAPVNGEAPFYYVNTEDDRLRCEKEMVNNPFPITKEGLDRAKPLYDVYCGVCHGAKGDGQGVLVTVPDAKYPAAPKNLIGDDMIAAGNGRYYFAMMYGKNVMGGYSDKLSFEERWQVLHYIRSLQAKAKNLEYSEKSNTLSNIEKPAKGAASGPGRTAPAAPAAPAPAPGK